MQQDQKLYYLIWKVNCLFYKREKHKGDNRLVRILCEYTFKKISTRCEEKSDLELLKLATGDLQVDF